MKSKPQFYIDPSDRWERELSARGFRYYVEPSPTDTALMESHLPAHVDVCLFDGYQFGPAIARIADERFTAQVVDMGGQHRASFLIAPGLGAERIQFNVPCVAGVAYAMLRPEFFEAHQKAMHSARESDHVVVSFGGRDSSDATGFVLDALDKTKSKIAVSVIMTSGAPHLSDVRRKVEALGGELLIDVADVSTLYLQCGLAIGGGGVSLAERMCCGIPSAIIAVADNQVENARMAQELGVARFLGARNSIDSRQLAAHLQDFIDDRSALRQMQHRGLQLVDGCGAGRVAFTLERAARRH